MRSRGAADRGCLVILAASTIGTAKSSLLSGVGPAVELRAFGIPVILDQPHVGRNLESHQGVKLQYAALRGKVEPEPARSPVLMIGAPFTQSLYLTALAACLCLVLGGALGLWAAGNDGVSAILRPTNDALPTMPQFVFLIHALMPFRVGEFTARIAIVLYAIVPPMRYIELATLPQGR